jgi:hypothetical protein
VDATTAKGVKLHIHNLQSQDVEVISGLLAETFAESTNKQAYKCARCPYRFISAHIRAH